MPKNNTTPSWDDTQAVIAPSFDETTPIEEAAPKQTQEQPLTYMQQELRNRGFIKDDRQPITTGELQSDKIGSETLKALKSSSARALGGILGLPAFIEDQIGSFVVKPIMKGLGYTEEEAQRHVDVMKQTPIMGTVLTSQISAGGQQQVNKYASSIESTMKQYEDGIIGSIQEGIKTGDLSRFSDAGAQLWRGAVQSVPYLAMTAATAGGGTPSILATIGTTAAAQRYGDLQDPESAEGKKLSETGKFLNSWAYGGMEAAGELVTAGVLNTARKAVGQIGEEAVQEIGKGFTKQILKDFALEGSSEGATELGQQVTDYLAGLRDNIDFKAIGDVVLVGGATGGGIGGVTATANKAAQVMAGRKVASDSDVETINKNNAQIVDLMAEKALAPTEDVASVIDSQIKTVVDENNKIITDNIDTATKLTTEEIVKVKDISDAIDSYDFRIENPTTEDNVELLTKIKDKLVEEKQTLVDEAKKRPTAEIKPTETISEPVEATKAEKAPIVSTEGENAATELKIDISQMSSDELRFLSDKIKQQEKDSYSNIFGENADRIRQIELSQESSTITRERHDKLEKEKQAIIDALPEEKKQQWNDFLNTTPEYDRQETNDLSRVVSDVESSENIYDLSSAIKPSLVEFSKRKNENLRVVFNSAIKKANELGIATEDLIAQVSKNIAKDFKDPQDAEDMVKSVLSTIAEVPTGKEQPTVVGDQIQLEQQKQLENGKEIRGNEAQRQRRQERLLIESKIKLERETKIEENKARLGRIFDNAAKLTGARLDITSEEKRTIRKELARDVVDYVKTEFDLLGEALVEKVKSFVRENSIPLEDISDKELNDVLKEKGYAEGIRAKTETPSGEEGMVEGEKERIRVRSTSQDRVEAGKREKVAKEPKAETTEDSRLGVRWAWGKSFSPEAQAKYKADGLYSYKPEKQSDVEFTARSIVENNTEKEALRVVRDKNVARRVRTAVGVLLIEKMDANVSELNTSGNKKQADAIVDDITELMEYIQNEFATESGRDISFLGSNFIVQRLGGYTLARMAQKGMEQTRAKVTSKKSYQNIQESAKKELSGAYNEAVEETIRKVVAPKANKQVDPKIAEVRKKRNSLIEQWKKERGNPSNAYSTVIPGLTQVDIEYGGRIALTYIEEGVYRTEDLVKKLKKTFKQVGLELSDSQAEKLIPEKVGDKPLEDYQQEQDLQKVTEALAQRIFGDVIEKTAKIDDPLKKMVDTLFSKFKDTQLERQKGVKPDLLTKLSMAIQNAKEYKEVWTEARDTAIGKIEADKQMSDEQKQKAIEKVNTAYKNATEFTFSDKLVKDIVRQELRDKNIDIADVVRDHFDRRNVVKEDLKKTLIEKANLEPQEAAVLTKAIESTFDTLIASKSSQIIDKYVNKGKRKPSRKQVKGADEIIQLANTGAFENEQFINAFADAWGVPNLDKEDIRYIIDQSKRIQKIKGEAMKYEEKQKLLAHIANIEGIDWGELVDGIWYANVLSGAGTQLKNFLDANTAAIVEPLLIAGSSPFKRARLRSAIKRTATGRALQNLRHTFKTGKHPFDLGSETPKLGERILESKDPMVKNKAAWGAIKAASMYQNAVFNLMMSNDAFAGTMAYESILDAIITEAAYSEAKGSSGTKLTKEQKDALNRKIDEMLRITPEDQKIINEQLDKESEEYKQIQAEKGEKQTGYSKEQRNVRFYEIMDSLRPMDFVEEARRISLEAVGNIQPYGTLGFVIDKLSGGLTKLGVEIHKPMLIKTGGGYKIAYSPTETFKIRPLQKIIPFTRIITNIATRNLNWNIYSALIRLASGKYGKALDLAGHSGNKYVREMTKEEKKILKRKIIATATIVSLAYALTGGDDPEDSLIRITANGTGDFQKNKLLTQAGWRPWSIIIGDKAISYQYLYPLNMILSAVGYVRDQQIYQKSDRSFMSLYAEGAFMTLGQVLFSTPMSGISSAFKTLGDLIYKGTENFATGALKLVTNIGGGFISPRTFDDVDRVIGILAERKDVEGVTFMEKLADKIPFVGRNFAGKVEAIDIFGDNIPIQTPVSSVLSFSDKFKNTKLSKWLIEDIGYYRPIPEYGQTTFHVYEKDGSENLARKLVKGNNQDEAFFTAYNKAVGRYFKEAVLSIKEQGLEPEMAKNELKKAWDDSVEKAKEDMFLLSQDRPLNTTQLK